MRPSANANRVWSRPRPTPAPGWKRVPRWRTMMLPGITDSPPNFLTPSRCPGLSRALRELPPAFLCAIALLLLQCRFEGGSSNRLVYGLRDRLRCRRFRRERAARADRKNAHRRQILPMALGPPVVLATLLLEDDQLRPASLLQHAAEHPGLRGNRRADQRRLAVPGDHQDLIEGDDIARLGVQSLDDDPVAFGDPMLFAARADHCEHGQPRTKKSTVPRARVGRRGTIWVRTRVSIHRAFNRVRPISRRDHMRPLAWTVYARNSHGGVSASSSAVVNIATSSPGWSEAQSGIKPRLPAFFWNLCLCG